METATPAHDAQKPSVGILPLRSWLWIMPAAVLYLAGLGLGLLAKSMGRTTPELGVDVELSHGRSAVLTGFSEVINYVLAPAGTIVLLVLIFCWMAWRRRRPLQALAFTSVAAVGWLSSTVAKQVVSRPRPPADAVSALVRETQLDSFPSGHTAVAVSLALAVVLVVARNRAKRLLAGVAGLVFVALVAFSRLYLGAHYISDVSGSLLISGAAILAWLPIWNNLLAPPLARRWDSTRMQRAPR